MGDGGPPAWGASFEEIASVIAADVPSLGVLRTFGEQERQERAVQAILVLCREGGGLAAVPAGCLTESGILEEEAFGEPGCLVERFERGGRLPARIPLLSAALAWVRARAAEVEVYAEPIAAFLSCAEPPAPRTRGTGAASSQAMLGSEVSPRQAGDGQTQLLAAITGTADRLMSLESKAAAPPPPRRVPGFDQRPLLAQPPAITPLLGKAPGAEMRLGAGGLVRAGLLASPPAAGPPQRQGVLAGAGAEEDEDSEGWDLDLETPTPAKPEMATLLQVVTLQSRALEKIPARQAPSDDPLEGEATAGSSLMGSRGARERELLRMMLLGRSGAFSKQVQKNMRRRMGLDHEPAGIPYPLVDFERRGGHRQQKSIGPIAWLVGEALRAAWLGQGDDAVDQLAILLMVLEQSEMDKGSFDVAWLLSVEEEPPANVFANSAPAAPAKGRAFSPLASQSWTTVAMACLRELDALQTRRSEALRVEPRFGPERAKRKGEGGKAPSAKSGGPAPT